MGFVQKYFLRLYAIELDKQSSRRAPAALNLGPYGEARMRTVLLLVIIMNGLGASALVVGLACEATRAFLLAYRPHVLTVYGAISVVASVLVVNRSLGKFEHSPQFASAFGTERDQEIRALQFYGILVCSVAAPIVTSILLH